jgi:hypothetical protein
MPLGLDLGLGIAPSASNQSQSGGPFTNNSEIVFGNGIFGATYQDQSAESNPSAAASGYGAAVANPYAPNATGSLLGSSNSSSLLLYAGLAVAAVAVVWYLHKKGKI